MATLQDVRERIKSDMAITGSIYDVQIDDAIRSALRELRGRKFWFLEAVGTTTIPSGSAGGALPSDFGNPGSFSLITGGLWLGDGNGFDFLSLEKLKQDYWNTFPIPTGQPEACSIVNRTLYSSHTADQDYTVSLFYFRQDAAPPTAAETSVWFDDGYDVVRSKAQYIFKRDSQQYTVSEADGDMADMHMKTLERRHERYEAGR